MVFTEHELRRYKDYVIIVALGIVLGFISKIGIFTGIGMMFVLFFVVDLLMIPMGMLVARIMFKAAGLDAYLEEYRTQFAAYLEANPDVLEIAKGTTEG